MVPQLSYYSNHTHYLFPGRHSNSSKVLFCYSISWKVLVAYTYEKFQPQLQQCIVILKAHQNNDILVNNCPPSLPDCSQAQGDGEQGILLCWPY